ncbi:MAG TPA: hypothetical protein VKR32_06505 [Puia sp.]|nr:hypothetical protein [Puia sp.]
MKRVLFAIVLLTFSCKKASNNSSTTKKTGPSIFYTAKASVQSFTVNPTVYHIDSTYGSAECLLYNGAYMFNFNEDTASSIWGVLFAIPSSNYPGFQFPLDSAISFDLNDSATAALASASGVTFNLTETVGQCDSVHVTFTVSRNSDSTIDGTFSGTWYSSNPFGTATVTNGTFKNLPLKQ